MTLGNLHNGSGVPFAHLKHEGFAFVCLLLAPKICEFEKHL